MKTVILAAVCAVAVGQSPAGSIAGVWTAQFQGQTFVRLELASAGGALAGGITLGHFQLDKTGAVSRADAAPRELQPISEVQQRGAIVTFSVAGTDEPDRFELRLMGPRHAELRLLVSDEDREELAAEGIPAPRPIPLTKQ